MTEGLSPYLLIKTIHIISAVVLFGVGLGSAFYKFQADRAGNLENIVFANRTIVLGDLLFIAPSVIVQPITGVLLSKMGRYPLNLFWIQTAVLFFILGGLCWIAAVVLQIRMRSIATQALVSGSPLSNGYNRLSRYWFWLGVFGFSFVAAIFPLMVFKPMG